MLGCLPLRSKNCLVLWSFCFSFWWKTVQLTLITGAAFFLQAVSDIVLGGDLVTTVCHSSPFIVDITPPIMHSVSDVIFDDGFRFLAVYYNATDNLSGIGRLEFGLGKTKYDVMIRKYMPFEIQGNEDNTHLLNKEFETASAVPAWIRLKVVDNGWCTSRSSSSSFQVLC